ncbi:MAG TPA: hypothetical protein ENK64_01620 [Flavobacteriales bacterium]|nr:hypothetical protein [Flavobacteriales bacterium]
MIAVIKGDIIKSRQFVNQEKWLKPLKNLFNSWGEYPKDWKLDWGDFFQVEIKNPEDALKKAFQIKALIKKVTPIEKGKKMSTIDVRMAIGIGEKTYSGEAISESNGPAFIFAGEKFDLLKKENVTIGIKSAWPSFDEEINLCLKLATVFMDKWSASSAELVEIVLKNPTITQEEIGKQIGIKQNSVSGRWHRSQIDKLLEVENIYRKKINCLLK